MQIRVVGPEDYETYLAETEVPPHEPILFVESKTSSKLSIKFLAKEVSKELSYEGKGKFSNIKTEKLKQGDATNAAISRMYPATELNLEEYGDDEAPLHNELDSSSNSPRGKHKIMTTSDKEARSILFIQARIRVNFTVNLFL